MEQTIITQQQERPTDNTSCPPSRPPTHYPKSTAITAGTLRIFSGQPTPQPTINLPLNQIVFQIP